MGDAHDLKSILHRQFLKLKRASTLATHQKGLACSFVFQKQMLEKGLKMGFAYGLEQKKTQAFALYRSNIEVLNISEIALKKGNEYHFVIEKIENHVNLYLDGQLVLNFMGYIPLVGSHVGLVCKDTDFQISDWKVFVGSQSAMINCLSVPDAFLASQDFTKAYSEYQTHLSVISRAY